MRSSGVRALLVNARYKEHELSYVLRDAGAVAIVTTDLIGEYVDFVPLIERATADPPPLLRHRIMIGASSPDGYLDRAAFLARGDAVTFEELELRRHAVRVRDVALLMYTSGTTANPKGCLITHEGLVRTAAGIVDRFRLTEDEKFWDPLPLFHMAGLLLLLSNLERRRHVHEHDALRAGSGAAADGGGRVHLHLSLLPDDHAEHPAPPRLRANRPRQGPRRCSTRRRPPRCARSGRGSRRPWC